MSQNKMSEETKLGWEFAVIMVCTKCGKQFEDANLKDSPERIKSDLKAKAKSEFSSGVRVITTSCLNICPVNKIAVAIASTKQKEIFKALSVDPMISSEDLFKAIF